MGYAQQVLKHFPVVLPDQRGRAGHPGRGCGHFEGGVLELPGAEHGVLHRHIHIAMAQLGVVVHPVPAALDGHGADAGGLAFCGQFVLVPGFGPFLNVAVHFLLALQTAGEGVKAGVGPVGAAHQLHQVLPLVIGETGDDGPVVVAAGGGAIGVMGRGHGAAVVVDDFGARPDGAVAGRETRAPGRAAVDGFVQESRANQSDAGNHLGQIYVLALAGGGTVAQGGQRADGAVHSAGVVQVRPAPAGRGLAGQAGEVREAAQGLGRRPHGAVPVMAPGVAEARH